MNKVMLLLFVTSVALGATTLHLVRELRAERAHALTLETRVAQLERPAPPPPSPFASPSEGPAPEPVAPPTTTIVSTAPAPKPTPPVGDLAAATVAYGGGPMPSREDRMRMMRQRMEQQRALLRDPAYRDAMMTQQKAMMGNMYPDLANELNLAPGEFERLTTLLAEQQLRSMEQQSGPFFDGPPDSATAQEMQRKAQANRQVADAELKALLGDEKWNAWRDYQSTMGVRHEVAQLRTSLANQGAPLTDDQIKPLQRALADAQQGKVQAWNRTVSARSQLALAGGAATVQSAAARLEFQEESLRLQQERNQQVRDSVGSILTGEQMRVFEEQQNAQLRLQEAHLRIARAQAEAEARGEVAPAGNAFFVSDGNAVFVTPAPSP